MNIAELVERSANKVYAGVGSRETPEDVLVLMTSIARRLDALGWRLRTGGAGGADSAFEEGVERENVDLFLPWRSFNGRTSRFQMPTREALDIAAKHHPGWRRLSDAGKRLIARNVHQILGENCDAPAAFVVCWTPDGATTKTTARTGGTGQAIRVANAHGVPVFNLAIDEHREAWTGFAAPRNIIIST
jgi:hypothetical protein